jgi:hypothetical protein
VNLVEKGTVDQWKRQESTGTTAAPKADEKAGARAWRWGPLQYCTAADMWARPHVSAGVQLLQRIRVLGVA